MIQLLIFLILSVPLTAVSWKLLRQPESHGFPRFLAWETILGSFLLNVRTWFQDPFSWHQILSWLLLILSLLPLTLGIRELRTAGKPDRLRRPDAQLLGFERTTALVTSGIYRAIRHPLYCSLLLLAWGICFKDPSQTSLTLAGIATVFLRATALADEKECAQTFGSEYREYMGHSRMFLPFVY